MRDHTFLAVWGWNLLVPGGGLVLAGRLWLGLVVGLLFTLAANLAVLSALVVPDDVPGWLRIGFLTLSGTIYVLAQWLLAQRLRGGRRSALEAARRRALAAAVAALERGEAERAVAALAPLRGLADGDLVVAYRWAQVLTAARDVPAARAAWERVAALDRHRIYRAQIAAALQELAAVELRVR
jgi:hypothetical protein